MCTNRIDYTPSHVSENVKNETLIKWVTCHWVPGSLRPGFIASQVLCVCNFYATFFCNFLQLLCNFLLQKKVVKTVAKKLQKKSCNKRQKSCNKLAKSCKKMLHNSCKHIEPGTQ